MKKLLILASLIIVLSGQALIAQETGELNAIQTVVPFLTIAPDSRSGAMGDAGVATSPDVYSLHWNPAKYAFIDGDGGVGLSYSPWLRNLIPDINIAYLTGYKRIDSKQVAAASLLYSSLGPITFTDNSGMPIREFNPNEFAFDLAYSRLFSEKFSGGVAFRFIYSNLTGGMYSDNIATRAGISVAADVSGYYQNDINIAGKDGSLAFGVNFSNIGSKMSYSDTQSDFIPMNFRIGTAATIELDDYNKITGTFDINKLLVPTPPKYDEFGEIIDGKNPDVAVPVAFFTSWFDAPGGIGEELRELTFSPGIEYWYNNQFAVRGGYFHESQTKGNRKYFTVGAGLRLKAFAIDFSYLMPLAQNHPLANTLRFSLSFDIKSMRNSSTE
ncbi:MAG TPA: type IX secretion system outer membrane channel protein PorV [Bacteroidales bacterium]|nr:type IX secretion system outer membrane channel protein PorV [Bacteroidales bacterium]